jgi:hypothetical protein
LRRSLVRSDRYSAMKKYEIILLNKKTKIYSTISWLIIAFNFIAFLFAGVSGLAEKKIYPFIAAGILLVLFVQSLPKDHFLQKNKQAGNKSSFNLFFTVIILSWLFMQFYGPAAINALLFFFNTVSRRKLKVVISEAAIIYPSFPKTSFSWNDLNNIILKDGLLTIDFKNNKLAQSEVVNGDNDYALNEKEFNDFCSQQIQATVSAI